jgi:glycosyltransferase A (GT-A) superfamily protein (DUF2064 family)
VPEVRLVLASTTSSPSGFGVGDVSVWDHGGGDLGAKVERILRRGLEEADVVFAVGADTVGLRGADLQAAMRALDTAPAVLGPTDDGGFYLLGLRSCPEGLLAGLPWSSPNTFDATRERLVSRLGSVAHVPPRHDLDHPADLQAYLARVAAGEAEAGHAAAVTREIVAKD